MGGEGSGGGYRGGWFKKTTVERCRELDVYSLAREGVLRAGIPSSGGWTWYREMGERREQTASINYEVDTRGPAPWLRLSYAFKDGSGAVDYTVALATTRPHFGGSRWWFVCPLVVGGRPCGRRVGKLFLPPSGRYFGCRHCYELTYESAQRHDARVDALRRNPDAIDYILSDAVDGPFDPRILLALKAMRQ